MNRKGKKGFTLVELVVVIAILAVLAAIAIPTVSGLISRAHQSSAMENCRSLESAFRIGMAELEEEGMEVPHAKNGDISLRLYSSGDAFDNAGGYSSPYGKALLKKIQKQIATTHEWSYELLYTKGSGDLSSPKLTCCYYPNGDSYADYYLYENGKLTKEEIIEKAGVR